jgi:hypothetical protein
LFDGDLKPAGKYKIIDDYLENDFTVHVWKAR